MMSMTYTIRLMNMSTLRFDSLVAKATSLVLYCIVNEITMVMRLVIATLTRSSILVHTQFNLLTETTSSGLVAKLTTWQSGLEVRITVVFLSAYH